MTRIALVLAALALGACTASRVDIEERPPSGFTATARSEPGEKCDAKLRQRASDEANYHCEARGRRAVLENRSEQATAEGCTVVLDFSCGSQ